jgi:hypothetical protein
VLEVVVQAAVAPALVGTAWLAARRWGHEIAGIVGAFPAIVGPVLLIGAHGHGAAFAAQEAAGTLLGLSGLSGFAVAYGRMAEHASWPASLAAGWAAAAGAAGLAAAVGGILIAALILAVGSLVLAHRGLPRTPLEDYRPVPPRWDLALRLSLTAVLVVSLAAAASWLGATVGGVLTALPVLACVLAVFTHRCHGSAAATQLLRGMLSGMAGFVAFCVLVAALVETAGVVPAFIVATGSALIIQAAIAGASRESTGTVARYEHDPRVPGRGPRRDRRGVAASVGAGVRVGRRRPRRGDVDARSTSAR